MSIIGKFRASVKKYMAEADQRAERRLAKAKTEAGREKVQAKITQERLATKREIAQAKTALLQAEAKQKKAAKEVRDIGGDVFSSLRRYFEPPKPRRHRKARKRVTGRR